MRFVPPSIGRLAKKYGKDPAYIFFHYSLQKGFVPLMKSVNESHIVSNADIFAFELAPGSPIMGECASPISLPLWST
ncbi:oxidoreductase [Lactarius psammicola]|nr:oxidoreductase [Lactarius psammicola]